MADYINRLLLGVVIAIETIYEEGDNENDLYWIDYYITYDDKSVEVVNALLGNDEVVHLTKTDTNGIFMRVKDYSRLNEVLLLCRLHGVK